MTTETPIADSIRAERDALMDLGFHPGEAKAIIIARTLSAANAVFRPLQEAAPTPIPGWAVDADFTAVTPEPKLLKLVDNYGDAWILKEGETDNWYCPANGLYRGRPRAEVERFNGPVKEVFA